MSKLIIEYVDGMASVGEWMCKHAYRIWAVIAVIVVGLLLTHG